MVMKKSPEIVKQVSREILKEMIQSALIVMRKKSLQRY